MAQDTATSTAMAMDELKPAIPPTSHLNFIAQWWQRSEKTSQISEARLLSRLKFFSAGSEAKKGGDVFARVGLVDIGGKDRKINTLVIERGVQETRRLSTSAGSASQVEPTKLSRRPSRQEEEQFSEIGYKQTSQVDLHLQEGADLSAEGSEDGKKVLVMTHGYGAGLGFFYRHKLQWTSTAWMADLFYWSSRPKWKISKKRGQSWNEMVEQTEEFFVESLEDWRRVNKISKFTLMGHSLGGYLSSCYALKYPERVERLVLVSPVGIPENPDGPTPTPEEKRNESPGDTVERDAAAIANAERANIAQQSPSSPTSSTSPAPRRRRIPGWAAYLWNLNITPFSIVRMGGPIGANLVSKYALRRFAHLDEADQLDMYDYLYHISTAPGSGEYALAAILSPGAYARTPLLHRLPNLKMPVTFLYGEQDWMDYRAAHHVIKIRKDMGLDTSKWRVGRVRSAGHHLYLDNPMEFDQEVIREMRAVERGE
ncbi:hypothetical protein BZG36_01422 [Bifiguratus adelaidae]|uniref:AB hydrolase-1 domain-containing protein n=1 Tax=Bifiguratus adelaidae TaxID=1938954 RepID=A0A261Y535_9FUNG|nr:hypothetical protein BZG36_01422 [Bifiguratus adelaidae]